MLSFSSDKAIVKEFKNGCNFISDILECVFLSCPIFKFNDYKKKQERNLLITNFAIYNCKANSTLLLIKPLKEESKFKRLKRLQSAKSGLS